MGIAITAVISVICLVFFCMDCAGKINREAAGTGVIYASVPALQAVVLCLCAYRISSIGDFLEAFGSFDDWSEDGAKSIFGFAAECAASLPSVVLSVIGCIRLAIHNGKADKSEFFGSSDDLHCLSVWSKLSSVLGAVCTAAFAGFAAFAVVKIIGTTAVNSLELFLAAIFLGCFTFGIGFIVMAVLFPLWSLMIGFHSIVYSISEIMSAGIFGTDLIVFQVLSAAFTAARVRKLLVSGSITKKKAALYIFLSLLPFVSVINAARIDKKLSHGI